MIIYRTRKEAIQMDKEVKKGIMKEICQLTHPDGWNYDPETVSTVQELGSVIWGKKKRSALRSQNRSRGNK